MKLELFNQNLPLLEKIFGEREIRKRKKRLKTIFLSTERAWNRNLTRLEGKKVKNVLIAEAAPWSESGTPRYFYNRIESAYHKMIWRAFFGFQEMPSGKKAYTMLADRNFLLIDSVPFSMNYKGKRNKTYRNLVGNCVPWWVEKLNTANIEFDEKINIAFALIKNGRSIIEATNGTISIKGQTVELTEDRIAANGAGMIDPQKLKTLFT